MNASTVVVDVFKPAFLALADHEALNVEVIRQQQHANMYEEAAVLAKHYPQLRPWLPKQPPIWMPEPRNTVYFEALAMALQVLDGA